MASETFFFSFLFSLEVGYSIYSENPAFKALHLESPFRCGERLCPCPSLLPLCSHCLFQEVTRTPSGSARAFVVLVSNVLPFHPPSTGGKGALGHIIAAAECTSPWYLAQLGWSWWLAWWSCSLACGPSAIRAVLRATPPCHSHLIWDLVGAQK